MTKYQVTAPATPGAQPTVIGAADTLSDARRIAKPLRARPDLSGQDVRIERPDGQLVEYAGPVALTRLSPNPARGSRPTGLWAL